MLGVELALRAYKGLYQVLDYTHMVWDRNGMNSYPLTRGQEDTGMKFLRTGHLQRHQSSHTFTYLLSLKQYCHPKKDGTDDGM